MEEPLFAAVEKIRTFGNTYVGAIGLIPHLRIEVIVLRQKHTKIIELGIFHKISVYYGNKKSVCFLFFIFLLYRFIK